MGEATGWAAVLVKAGTGERRWSGPMAFGPAMFEWLEREGATEADGLWMYPWYGTPAKPADDKPLVFADAVLRRDGN